MDANILPTASVAFATFFATIGPLDVAAIYAGLTAGATAQQRRSMAVRGVLVATIILLLFALAGETILDLMGISLAALRTAGGVLLLLMGIEMVFARTSGATSTTPDEIEEAAHKDDIAIFPLATPLIAGPGAMGAAILLMANASGNPLLQGVVLLSLLGIMVTTLLILLAASQLQKLLGVTAMHVITRVMGVILAALAVQFIFDGVRQSGIFA